MPPSSSCVPKRSVPALVQEWVALRQTGAVRDFNQRYRQALEPLELEVDNPACLCVWEAGLKPELRERLLAEMRIQGHHHITVFDDTCALAEEIERSMAYISAAPLRHPPPLQPHLHLSAAYEAPTAQHSLPPSAEVPLAQALRLAWSNQGTRAAPSTRRPEAIPAPEWGARHKREWGDAPRPRHLSDLGRFVREAWELCPYCRDPDHQQNSCEKLKNKKCAHPGTSSLSPD
ncbi:hypothetical protein L198_04265 [Cryptococcus wingfieldii CBS 7118]|uniref:Uncharacterized protein n=1 Tax=Cryptococcus wingfieldii CBS 7118 TaxID=1295528 RepID=A0A1E3J6Q9_9TREE|nr:hypothetical protein L198_04265 [Cryptococcus wingfieldii CBS 7118]ODN96550.1 hypothetical protein L198_04265 [Cryptococcus wingfieldii CBS 7118]